MCAQFQVKFININFWQVGLNWRKVIKINNDCSRRQNNVNNAMRQIYIRIILLLKKRRDTVILILATNIQYSCGLGSTVLFLSICICNISIKLYR